MLNVNVIVICL